MSIKSHTTMIQSELTAFFKAYPHVTIEQFAQVANVYVTTIKRGLDGEALLKMSVERIRNAFEHYGFKEAE